MRKSCIDALIDFEDESLDMIFIDANHSFDRVKEDIENWSKKVRKGGIVSGHDYNHPNFPGVTVVVNDWTQKNNYKLNIEDGHVWWIVK